MSMNRPTLVSEEEFLALPESMDRVELVDGEVIVAPSPSLWHQELLGRIVVALRTWAGGRPEPMCVGMAPLDIRFAAGRILQPDAFVILEGVPLDRESPLDRIPEVCVEILSTNRAFDRLTKRLIYAAAGVLECWIVEPGGLIERWHGSGLNEREDLTRRLHSPLLPGFELDIEQVFRK
jgi:Uma2 family endonuclease